MERVVGKFAPYLYVLLRMMAGLLFAWHGAQKLFGLFGGMGGQHGAAVPLFSLMGLAGCIELVGGLLIALGVLTSFAAFVASGEMAVAYFMQSFSRGFWPIRNGGGVAGVVLFLFLLIGPHGRGVGGLCGRRTPGGVEATQGEAYGAGQTGGVFHEAINLALPGKRVAILQRACRVAGGRTLARAHGAAGSGYRRAPGPRNASGSGRRRKKSSPHSTS